MNKAVEDLIADSQGTLSILVAFSVLFGLIQCFFGYRIFKFVLAITGCLIGAALGATIGFALSRDQGVSFLSAVAGAIVVSFLSVFLYVAGVFVVGAFFGSLVGTFLLSLVKPEPQTALIVIPAIIGGIIAVIFSRFMIIASTSFAGAWSVVAGFDYLNGGRLSPLNPLRILQTNSEHLPPLVLAWLLLGIFGVFVQYRYTARRKQPESDSTPSGHTHAEHT